MASKTLKPKGRVIAGYLAPGLLIYCFIVIVPLIISLIYSFYDYSGGASMKFIGLKNYFYLIKDMDFWHSFKNNLVIILLSMIGQVGIALIITAAMISKLLKFKTLHRNIIFLPVVVSAIVVGFLWTIIYNKDFGFLNFLLKSVGLGSLIVPWLDNPKSVMVFVSIPIIWQYIGFYLVIFLAAIQGIPKDIYESADIDGAVGIKRSLYITIPLLSDTLKVTVMLCIAGNMKIFDHIFVMTGGGPGTSSMVMSQYAYINSFVMFKLGYGSAISIGILVLSLALILTSRKLWGGNKDEE
jgi:raffinose/stachyose/melibiose transport system permease protein